MLLEIGHNLVQVNSCQLERGQDYHLSFKIQSNYKFEATPIITQSHTELPIESKVTPDIWYGELSDTNNYLCKFRTVTAQRVILKLSCQCQYRTKYRIWDIKYERVSDDGQQSTEIVPKVTSWKELILQEINLGDRNHGYFEYPLIENTYDKEEIISMIEVLMGNRLTMGNRVTQFEQEFAKHIGAKYAIMVNSGSSANLLAMAVASNYQRAHRLKPGDKVMVPAVCWSTSVWPIIQMNLKPVLVDVDPTTMNMDLNDLKRKLTPEVKGIVAVHILGNCTNMEELMKIVREHKLFLMEDTCESLGSTYDNQYLGTFGDFGTFSFYYSHHITTVEGGMIVTNNEEDYELLKCLRAHGWTRYLKNKKEYEEQYPEVDSRFLFVNVGYNLRPMEIQAAMGLIQLSKLETKNNYRNDNQKVVTQKIISDPRNRTQILLCPKAMDKSKPAWFGMCFLLGAKYQDQYRDYLKYLTEQQVENRPIVTGNFARQPALQMMNLDVSPDDFPGADILHYRGFFIGLSCRKLTTLDVNNLVDILLNYFQPETT